MSIDVKDLISNIRPLDAEAMEKARQWQARLAIPPGSLGKLEDAAVRISGITGKLKNDINRCRIIVLAADNGIEAAQEALDRLTPFPRIEQGVASGS